jgi:hypothetical protein
MSKSFTTALTLNSTTLFPQSATVTANLTQVVSGSAGFDILVISQSSVKNLYTSVEADPSNTVYFYAQALPTNTSTIFLEITGSNTSGSNLVRLRPGDMTYMPLNVNAAGVAVNCVNTASAAQNIYSFYAQRS